MEKIKINLKKIKYNRFVNVNQELSRVEMVALQGEEICIRPERILEVDWLELTGCEEGQSAIDPRIAAAGWKSIDDAVELVKILNLGRGDKETITNAQSMLPGWAVRGINPTTGERNYDGLQYKFRNPPPKLDHNGRPIPGRYKKYRSASDMPTATLFLQHWDEHFWEHVKNDLGQCLWITEGAKKAASLLSASEATVALPGVWNGQKRGNLLPSLRQFLGSGRTVYIVFDRDWMGNRGVAAALDFLGNLICSTGAVLRVATPPEGYKGVDDYIAGVIREGGRRDHAVTILQELSLSFQEWRDRYLSGDAKPIPASGDEILPHAVDLELEVLTAITNSNLTLPDLKGWEFYLGAHQAWWLALLQLSKAGTVIDFATVSQKLVDLNKLNEVTETLGHRWGQEGTLTPETFEAYLEVIKEKAARRRAIAKLGVVTAQLKDPKTEVQVSASELQQLGYDLATGATADSLKSLGEHCVTVQNQIIERYDGTEPEGMFLKTHMPYFAQRLGGFERGVFVVTAGRPGSGKTTFGIFQGLTNAIAGSPSLVFSLEMSAEQLVYRVISSYTGIAFRRLQMGLITDLELEIVVGAVRDLSTIPLFIDDRPNITVSEIAAKTARIRELTAGALDLVVLDYVQLMGGHSANATQELTTITNGLREIAKQSKVFFNCISQLNRGVENRKDKRPIAPDLRQSGALEEAANVILMLYRDKFYNPGSVMGSVGEVIVTKNRNHTTGTIPIYMDLAHYRVLDPFWASHRTGAAAIRQRIEIAKANANPNPGDRDD